MPFGAIPAGRRRDPDVPGLWAERRLDRRRKDPQFGKGAIRGLAAPESAANATAGSAMGSLLALGLPTSATAAIMLAAFQQYGMQPGPLLFTRNSDLVWALLASLFVGMFVLLIINLPFAPLWAKLLLIPKPYLYAGITVFAVLGVYAGSSSLIDLVLLVLIGLLGFVLRRYGLPAGTGADRGDPRSAGRDEPAPRAGGQRGRCRDPVRLRSCADALRPAGPWHHLGRGEQGPWPGEGRHLIHRRQQLTAVRSPQAEQPQPGRGQRGGRHHHHERCLPPCQQSPDGHPEHARGTGESRVSISAAVPTSAANNTTTPRFSSFSTFGGTRTRARNNVPERRLA